MIIDILKNLICINRYNIFLIPATQINLDNIIRKIESEGIEVLNIGKLFAEKLNNIKHKKYLSIEAQELLNNLFDERIKSIENLPIKIIAVHNLGILLEPILSLNAENILKNISKQAVIIIIWENIIENNGLLHWGNQKENYNLNFSDITIKQLDITNEI